MPSKMMLTTILLALSWLFTNVRGLNNAMDLQGKTYIISDGNVLLFDGREIKNGRLVIAEGMYLLQVKQKSRTCLIIGDNTEPSS